MGIRGSAGTLVDLRDPKPSDFQPAPIARTLANEHRYAGNYGPYSVAQHAVLVARMVGKLGGDSKGQLAGLHHDDTEAVTGDLPKPVKNACPDFKALEARLARAVDDRYDIRTGANIVKQADLIVFCSEVSRLVPPDAQWMYQDEVGDVLLRKSDMVAWHDLVPWTADEAFARYMDLHEALS